MMFSLSFSVISQSLQRWHFRLLCSEEQNLFSEKFTLCDTLSRQLYVIDKDRWQVNYQK